MAKTSYFTESQYTLLSDKELEMLKGTNDDIDAEIKRRAEERGETIKTPEVITDTKEGGGIFKKGWESLKDLFSEADVPDEGLMQLAKGVTFRNPLEEKWKEGTKRIDEWGWDEGVEPITGDYTRDEFDLQLRKSTLNDDGQWLYEKAIKEGHDPEKVMNILQQKYTDDKRKNAVKQKYGVVFHRPETQISSSQYLMNQQKNLNPWLNAMPGVQVASTGDLTGMGIPNALQQQQQQAELMHAGNLALNQTPAQVQAQVAAAQATQQGNYQAPTMTQQQMVQEAQQTGGTVNPHEATQAAWTPPSRPSRPVRGPHGKAHGGMVGMNYLTRRL